MMLAALTWLPFWDFYEKSLYKENSLCCVFSVFSSASWWSWEYVRGADLASLRSHGTSPHHLFPCGHSGDNAQVINCCPFTLVLPATLGSFCLEKAVQTVISGWMGTLLPSFKSLQLTTAKVRRNILPIMLQFPNYSIWTSWLNRLQENDHQVIFLNTQAIMSGATPGTHNHLFLGNNCKGENWGQCLVAPLFLTFEKRLLESENALRIAQLAFS